MSGDRGVRPEWVPIQDVFRDPRSPYYRPPWPRRLVNWLRKAKR